MKLAFALILSSHFLILNSFAEIKFVKAIQNLDWALSLETDEDQTREKIKIEDTVILYTFNGSDILGLGKQDTSLVMNIELPDSLQNEWKVATVNVFNQTSGEKLITYDTYNTNTLSPYYSGWVSHNVTIVENLEDTLRTRNKRNRKKEPSIIKPDTTFNLQILLHPRKEANKKFNFDSIESFRFEQDKAFKLAQQLELTLATEKHWESIAPAGTLIRRHWDYSIMGTPIYAKTVSEESDEPQQIEIQIPFVVRRGAHALGKRFAKERKKNTGNKVTPIHLYLDSKMIKDWKIQAIKLNRGLRVRNKRWGFLERIKLGDSRKSIWGLAANHNDGSKPSATGHFYGDFNEQATWYIATVTLSARKTVDLKSTHDFLLRNPYSIYLSRYSFDELKKSIGTKGEFFDIKGYVDDIIFPPPPEPDEQEQDKQELNKQEQDR